MYKKRKRHLFIDSQYKNREHYSRVKWPQVFYVPRVGDDPSVLISDLECPSLDDLVDDEWPHPWGSEFVLILAALNSSED
jgi:hypothetical protein